MQWLGRMFRSQAFDQGVECDPDETLSLEKYIGELTLKRVNIPTLTEPEKADT